MTTRVMCGWCHEMVEASFDDPHPRCPDCGHQAGKTRMLCLCPACQAQRMAADLYRQSSSGSSDPES